MFSLNGTLKKKWVGRAMRNETIYWDGHTLSTNIFKISTTTVSGHFLHVFLFKEPTLCTKI